MTKLWHQDGIMRAGAWPTLTAQLVHGHGRARVRAVAEKGARILDMQSSRRRAPGAMRRRRAAVASMAVARELGRRLLFFLVPMPCISAATY